MVGIAVSPAILGFVQNSAPDLESGLQLVFLVSAIAVAIALLLIITIPEISLASEISEETQPVKTVPVEG